VGYVNDFADLIPGDTEAQLENTLRQFEQETTVEIAVVTVFSLNGDTIEDYAARLFEQWGIGKKDVDNGVLLLLAFAERDVRIEVGYGMEPYITDGQAGRILDQQVVPHLMQNNYSLGLLTGVRGIAQVIKNSDYVPGTVRPRFVKELVEGLRRLKWLLLALGAFSIYLFAYFARSRAIWPGGIWGALVGGLVGWLIGGLGASILFWVAAGALGVILDALLSSAYRYQTANGRPTSWTRSWGGFFGAGHGGFGGSGGFGGFGGGRSGGGGASRRF